MSSNLLLLEMARQFYEDCRYIADNNSTQPVDEDTCLMFNTLLTEMQQAYPSCGHLHHFREMPARSLKFKDAVIVAGQLYTIAHFLLENPEATEITEVPAGGRPAAPPARRVGVPTPGLQTSTPPNLTPSPRQLTPTGAAFTSRVTSTPPLQPSSRTPVPNDSRKQNTPNPEKSGRKTDTRSDQKRGYLSDTEFRSTFRDTKK